MDVNNKLIYLSRFAPESNEVHVPPCNRCDFARHPETSAALDLATSLPSRPPVNRSGRCSSFPVCIAIPPKCLSHLGGVLTLARG